MGKIEEIEKKIRRTELILIILKILRAGSDQKPVLDVVGGFADDIEKIYKGR